MGINDIEVSSVASLSRTVPAAASEQRHVDETSARAIRTAAMERHQAERTAPENRPPADDRAEALGRGRVIDEFV